MLLGGEGFKHHAALGLADALNDDLFCGLGGDAAEIFGLDLDIDQITDLCILLNFSCSVQSNLRCGRNDLVNDLFLRIHKHLVLVQLNIDVVGIAVLILFVSGDQRLRNAVYHVIDRNAAFLFQLTQSSKDFRIHCGISLYKYLLSLKIPRAGVPTRFPFFQR